MKKKIVITAGGTSEAIDKVRKITNSSSGKLGLTIANKILDTVKNIDVIYYVCSKNSLRPVNEKVKVIEIEGTMNLKQKVEELLTTNKIDYFIHSMAVSDYMIDYVTTAELLAETINEKAKEDVVEVIKNNKKVLGGNKISSYEDNLIIKLKPTPKIISLIKTLSPETYLVGFKLLDDVSEEELIKVATKLRDKNNCNLVVANDLAKIRKGCHQAIIIDQKDNKVIANGKEDIAEKLVEVMFCD